MVFGFSVGRKRAGRGARKLLKRSARLLRCLVAQRGVRPDCVVVIAPEGQLAPGVVQAVEDLFVQEFISQAAVEAFDERVLLRLAGINVVPRHLLLVSPFQDRPACELGPVTPSE